MKSILILLGQSSALLMVFYLLYLVFHKRTHLLKSNRVYLLLTPLLALLIPSVQQWLPEVALSTPNMAYLLEGITVEEEFNRSLSLPTLWESLAIVYMLGAVLSVIVLLYNLLSIRHNIKGSKKQIHKGITCYVNSNISSSFSFAGKIYIPPSILNNGEEEELLLQHELAHVRQKHSIDLLLMQVLGILFWFHPAIYMYKQELLENHEYLADLEVVKHTTNKETYSKLLAINAFGIQDLQLIHQFNQCSIKNRIKMIYSKSKKRDSFIYILSISLLVLSVVAISCNRKSANTEEVYKEVDVQPSYPGGQEGLIQHLSTNIKYPDGAKEDSITGTVFVSFVINSKGEVTKTEVIKGVDERMDQEAVRVIQALENWTPGEKDGKKVSVQYVIPIRFALN